MDWEFAVFERDAHGTVRMTGLNRTFRTLAEAELAIEQILEAARQRAGKPRESLSDRRGSTYQLARREVKRWELLGEPLTP